MSLKNITQKQKVLAVLGLVTAVVITSMALIVIPKLNEKEKEELPVEISEPKVEVTVEYGSDGKQMALNALENLQYETMDIPEINTDKVGEKEYIAILSGKEVVLFVTVQDTQSPVVNGKEEIEINIEDIDKLENSLITEFTGVDPVDGPVGLTFDIPEIDKVGNYKVNVIARDLNGNKGSKFVNVVVVETIVKIDPPKPEEPVVEKPVITPTPQPEVSNPTPSKPSTPSKPETPKPSNPTPKPVEPKPVEPKPETPKPVEPKPTQPDPAPGGGSETPMPEMPPLDAAITAPSGLPSGSSLNRAKSDKDLHLYNYNKTLSDGSKIDEYAFNLKEKLVVIIGKDSKGSMIFAKISVSKKTSISFGYGMPATTEQSEREMLALAKEVMSAYGY